MAVIADRNMNQNLLDALETYNIQYYKSFDIDYLYKPVNTHPDMQIHFVDKNTAFVAPIAFEYYKQILPDSVKLIAGMANPGRTYPEDTAYNVAKVGKTIIGKMSCVDVKIKEFYFKKGYEFINVNQGYTKCSICVVDENSLITEDEGIFRALALKNIDVLKIQPGYVVLPGFENGFLGGASGFIGKNNLAFCGNLTNHPEYKKIKTFIEGKNVNIIQLSSTKLHDFGSILYFDNNL